VIVIDLIWHLFKLVLRAAGNRPGEFELTLEGERQARQYLKDGRSLLRNASIHEADVRFGLALRLWPDVVASLPKKEQKRFLKELELIRPDEAFSNIQRVWIQLDRLRTAWGSRWEGSWYS
jgi:hypothetical protein